jgi:hypothetical protein
MLSLTKGLEPISVKADDDTEFIFAVPNKLDSIKLAETEIKRQLAANNESSKFDFTKESISFLADKLIEIRNIKVGDKIEPAYSDKDQIKKFFLVMPQEFIAKCMEIYSQRMAMSENFPID